MADQGNIAQQRNLEDVGLLLADHDAADHHGTAVADEDLCLGRLRVESGDAVDQRNAAIDLRIFDHHIHEHVAIGRDLRSYLQPQDRIDILDRDRIVNGSLDGNLRALLDLSHRVVLRHQLRTGEKLAYAFTLRGRDDEVQGEVRRYSRKHEAAGGCDRRQVAVQRDLPARRSASRGWRAHYDWGRGLVKERTGLGCDRITAKKISRVRGRAYAGNAKLSTDIARKGPGSLHNARLNLNLLRLSIELADQVIDLRHYVGDIADDQRIRPVDSHEVAA